MILMNNHGIIKFIFLMNSNKSVSYYLPLMCISLYFLKYLILLFNIFTKVFIISLLILIIISFMWLLVWDVTCFYLLLLSPKFLLISSWMLFIFFSTHSSMLLKLLFYFVLDIVKFLLNFDLKYQERKG